MMRVFRSTAFTVALFALAAILLVGGGIGAAQAAPRIQSEDYRAQVQLTNIEVALTENGAVKEGVDDLFQSLVPAGEKFQIGRTYPDELAARNVGTIDQFVRVTVTRYWTDGTPIAGADEKKVSKVDLDPSLINLHFVEGDGWTIDQAASTPERTVLYYDKILGCAQGSETGNPTDSTPFVDSITIDGKVIAEATELADGELEFDYEGLKFRVRAEVDAVQTHNPGPAMISAWGRTNVEG